MVTGPLEALILAMTWRPVTSQNRPAPGRSSSRPASASAVPASPGKSPSSGPEPTGRPRYYCSPRPRKLLTRRDSAHGDRLDPSHSGKGERSSCQPRSQLHGPLR